MALFESSTRRKVSSRFVPEMSQATEEEGKNELVDVVEFRLRLLLVVMMLMLMLLLSLQGARGSFQFRIEDN